MLPQAPVWNERLSRPKWCCFAKYKPSTELTRLYELHNILLSFCLSLQPDHRNMASATLLFFVLMFSSVHAGYPVIGKWNITLDVKLLNVSDWKEVWFIYIYISRTWILWAFKVPHFIVVRTSSSVKSDVINVLSIFILKSSSFWPPLAFTLR